MIEIATLPFYYLLLIFPVNEISTARFFTDASFSIQMDFILRLIEREWRGTKKNRKKENTLVRKHIRIDRDIVYINFQPIIYIYIYINTRMLYIARRKLESVVRIPIPKIPWQNRGGEMEEMKRKRERRT